MYTRYAQRTGPQNIVDGTEIREEYVILEQEERRRQRREKNASERSIT